MEPRHKVDYYFTKLSSDVSFVEIVKKLKMTAYPSDSSLGDDLDIFVLKKEFPKEYPPSQDDLIFFTDEKKFYQSKKIEDAGDYWIINLNTYKQK
jgi:hypothetical protein